jgi:phosphate starvation-inducible membrane PsiE
MKLFHWGLLLRYMVYGVLPLVIGFIIVEHRVGEGVAGVFFVVLALVLPFVALGWLGWQHVRHRKPK